MMWLNTYVLHPDGASCRHVERPACFLPSLHGYYAFLRRRIIKKCCRKGKKAAEIIKNAAGLKKGRRNAQSAAGWVLKLQDTFNSEYDFLKKQNEKIVQAVQVCREINTDNMTREINH